MKPYIILSIDGGGVRGAIVAYFLVSLEHSLRVSIKDCVHLVTGTSTGALIAMGIGTCGMSAKEVASNYNVSTFQRVFPESFLDRIFSVMQFQPKYNGEGKHAVVCEILKSASFRNQSSPRCLVPVFNLDTGKVNVHDSWSQDIDRPPPQACAVASAATAAPTYFPAEELNGDYCIDAGICVNDPVEIAVRSAIDHLKLTGQCSRPIFVLSIGTGFRKIPFKGEQMRSWGGIEYGKSGVLVDLLMDESLNQTQAEAMLNLWGNGSRLVRVNGDLKETNVAGELDCATSENFVAMQKLASVWWRRFKGDTLALFK